MVSWLRGVIVLAALVAALLGAGAPGVRAQGISGGTISPEFIDQILGDFLRRQGQQVGTPIPETSPVDRARDEALKAEEARQAQALSALARQRRAAEGEAEPLRTDLSALERDYSERLGENIELYGYDLFEQPVSPPLLTTGAISDDYVLGVGDEIIIGYLGASSTYQAAIVDREGRVLLPTIGPVVAAGRTFADFRAEAEDRVAAQLIDTGVYLSVGQVRSISVVVLGEVATPGVHLLTSLSSVLDALFVAGGVARAGSLRRIQVVRGDDYFWFDLYDILLGRVPSRELTLRDGDRILVPPLGATVAIGGKVRRPAIYELAEGEAEAAFGDMLAFAGGPLRPVGNRVLTLSLDPSGRQQVREAPQDQAGTVRDGDIAVVEFGDDVQVGSVFLEGHVRLPGRRSFASAPTVRALIPDVFALDETPYLLFAVLRTHEPFTNSPVFVPVDLQRVLSGVQDMPLKAEDRLIVLGLEDVRYLWSMEVQAVLAGGEVFDRLLSLVGGGDGAPGLPSATGLEAGQVSAAGVAAAPVTVAAADTGLAASGGLVNVLQSAGQIGDLCAGLFVLHNVVSTSQPGRFPNALLMGARDLEPIITPREPCPKIYDRYADLLPFVLEHLALLKGEVRIPGVYPVAPSTPLNTVLAYAGGTGLRVDLTKTEIMRDVVDNGSGTSQSVRETIDLSSGGTERVFVAPGDIVLFASRFSDRDEKPILLVGEFLRPGLYEVRRGERLSEVIARAGGLTPQAYPYGAVFTRERTKQSEKVAFERAARELEIALAEALTSRTTGIQTATGADALRALANQLREAEPVGRVVIEADPTVLQVRPELDTVLEGGDRLFMPKRPNSVTVIGDVLNEGTLQFVPGARVDEYIDKAGGLRRSADDGRIFVVLPNGEAQPVSVSAWNYTPVAVPPGATVVVPKEPAPFDAFAFIKDITQITSQLAITAAAVAAINRN